MNADRIAHLSNTLLREPGRSFRISVNAVIKRGFDILASAAGLMALAPVFAVLAILIKRESPGPVFYRGARAGKGGGTFQILKFRSMYERPDSYRGAPITARGDKRVTPLGRWLRDTKLNELPQLWNVLIGEMSLVGPRPEDPDLAMKWPASAREEILSVLPGITSPASVLYRDEESLLSTRNVMGEYLKVILPDKQRLDRLYVRNHSFLADLDILFWTTVSLILNITRQSILEGSLFAGPISRLMRRHVTWFVIDWLVALLAFGIAGIAWRNLQPFNWGVEPMAALALAMAVLFSLVNLFAGLHRIAWDRADAEDGLILALSNSFTTVLLLALNHLLPTGARVQFQPLPPEMIVTAGLLTLLGSLATRFRLRIISSFASRWLGSRGGRATFGERVLIVGAGESGQLASWLLRRGGLGQAFAIVGMLDDNPALQGMRVGGCWVLGGSGDVQALVKKHDVGVILLTVQNASSETQQQLTRLCTIPGTHLVLISDILSSIQTHLTPKPAGRTAFAGMGFSATRIGIRINGMEK
jgi:lipopolysaccharide/colanic/teichoic acid biosynthesis glycosyltransferase